MIKLIKISSDYYPKYRSEVIFNAYKWDPQVGDHNTVSEYVMVIDKKTAIYLEEMAENLSVETMAMEEELLNKPKLINKLGLPKNIKKEVISINNYRREDHIRLMRFDFHPTKTGWAVSEVNSDVPGGFAEASILPEIASKYFNNFLPRLNFGSILKDAYISKVKEKENIALVYASTYSDDRQVMQFIGDLFEKDNRNSYYLAPDNISWKNSIPYNAINNQKISGILRFFPLEWLTTLPKESKWKNYFYTTTPSCNHPIAIITQSKRLPLVWDELESSKDTWKKLLPKTIDPKLSQKEDGDWIFKPAYGRVGEGISIKSVISDKEYQKILKDAKKHPKDWVAQQMFYSEGFMTDENIEMHCCVGVFTVDGKRAGFYGRICPYARIDANAKDIPILVIEENENGL